VKISRELCVERLAFPQSRDPEAFSDGCIFNRADFAALKIPFINLLTREDVTLMRIKSGWREQLWEKTFATAQFLSRAKVMKNLASFSTKPTRRDSGFNFWRIKTKYNYLE
jgi:hypothetical protein